MNQADNQNSPENQNDTENPENPDSPANTQPAQPENAQPGNAQPMFMLEKIYIQDVSVEVPNAPEIFLENVGEPQFDIQLSNTGKPLQGNLFNSVLKVTVTAMAGEKTVFLVELKQAGIFRLHNIPQEQIEPILAVHCPTILLPYAREAISEAVSRAGFPPLYLQPVNFEAMYHAQLLERQQQNGAALN